MPNHVRYCLLFIGILFLSASPALADRVVVPESPGIPLSGGSGAAPLTPNQTAAVSTAAKYQFLPLLAVADDPGAAPVLWPLMTSRPLAGDHTHVTRAVILIHGADRNAEDGLERLKTIAGLSASSADAPTIIFAPVFPSPLDLPVFSSIISAPEKGVAHWNPETWQFGGESEIAPGNKKGVSSFTALDILLLYLADSKFFPAIKDIVIAGYGRGGDMAQRYALLGHAADLLAAEKKIALRFVIGGAQSYAYLTAARPKPKSEAFTPPDAKDCPDYHNYPYGIGTLNPYGRWTAANVARQSYLTRNVVYLVGDNDASASDTNCAAKLQGESAKARAVNYDRYLQSLFDAERKTHKLMMVHGVGDDVMALWASPCGSSALFADGNCAGSKP
ncbi:MAG: hypothetical protein WDO70_02945 [Alphaproteobacteria bacterium]